MVDGGFLISGDWIEGIFILVIITTYATHLLESGTDLSYIQKLLGHRSKTSEIYTHDSTKSVHKSKDPLMICKIYIIYLNVK
jgi:hypothetical protein